MHKFCLEAKIRWDFRLMAKIVKFGAKTCHILLLFFIDMNYFRFISLCFDQKRLLKVCSSDFVSENFLGHPRLGAVFSELRGHCSLCVD